MMDLVVDGGLHVGGGGLVDVRFFQSGQASLSMFRLECDCYRYWSLMMVLAELEWSTVVDGA